MALEESIDEIVDRIINETLKEEDKKNKIKPFRYLTNEEEIQAEINDLKITRISVMKVPEAAKFVDGETCLAGLGDIQTIENVIRKHEVSRKFKDK